MIDYIDINKITIRKKIKKELDVIAQEYTKEKKPFCYKAAKEYYEDTIANIEKKILRSEKPVAESDIKLPDFDFHQFGDIKKFKIVGTTPAFDNIKVGKAVVQAKIGEHIDYVYKPTGYGVSVYHEITKEEIKAKE